MPGLSEMHAYPRGRLVLGHHLFLLRGHVSGHRPESWDLPTVCHFLPSFSFTWLCCSLTAVRIFREPCITPASFSLSKWSCLEVASLSHQDSELANILAYQGPPGAVWSQANHLRFGFDLLTWTIRELLATDKRFVSGLPLLIIVVDGPKCILLFRFYRAFTAWFCHLFSHLSLNYVW